MKAKRLFFVLLLIVIFAGCSLNGKQEATLNSAKMAYLEARNNNKVALLVKLTYPDAVRYYQNKGDDAFKERFKPENNQAFFRSGIVKQVESNGEVIHVQFEFERITETEFDIIAEPALVYAISADNGKHWKFLDKVEYDNPEILPGNKKLITD
ncbi:MAG: hypothetical protein Crog4KO_25540 [Crocinitomicaceae bacterium]